jgi:adenine phosphoribosyltransferase
MSINLKNFVREVRHFPKPGIVFRDITPILADASLFAHAIEVLYKMHLDMGGGVIASPESRGFILGAALAAHAGGSFVPMRKPGKLPYTTFKCDYGLEYRDTDQLHMHIDAIQPGDGVLIVDDVLATGGTALAAFDLIKQGGGHPDGLLVLVELVDLGGRKKIESAGYRVESLLQY